MLQILNLNDKRGKDKMEDGLIFVYGIVLGMLMIGILSLMSPDAYADQLADAIL